MKKRILAILTASVLVLALLAGCSGGGGDSTPGGGDETYKLVVSLTKGENNTTALQAYLTDIEEASEGRIEFEIYYTS